MNNAQNSVNNETLRLRPVFNMVDYNFGKLAIKHLDKSLLQMCAV